MRYAQVGKGQKLHLVEDLGDYGLSQPLCGRQADHFGITINVPLGHVCHNCLRVYDARRRSGRAGRLPDITININRTIWRSHV